jgi:hypothetical protein
MPRASTGTYEATILKALLDNEPKIVGGLPARDRPVHDKSLLLPPPSYRFTIALDKAESSKALSTFVGTFSFFILAGGNT